MKSVLCLNFQVEEHSVAALALTFVYECLLDAGVRARFLDRQCHRVPARIEEDVVAVSLPYLDLDQFAQQHAYIRRKTRTAQIVVGGTGVLLCRDLLPFAAKYPDVWWYEKEDLSVFVSEMAERDVIAPSFRHTPLRWSGYSDEDLIRGVHRTVVLTATHCPFRCTFCASATQPYRLRDHSVVLREMETLRRRGVRRYDFVDASILYNPKWRELLEYSARERMIFGCITDVRRDDLLDNLRWMALHGMYYCIYGIETLNQRAIRAVKKGTDARVVRRFLRDLPGMRAKLPWRYHHAAFLIGGLPHQTYADVLEECRLCREAGIRRYLLSPLICMPGIFAEAVPGCDFASDGTLLRTRWMTEGEVRRMRSWSGQSSDAEMREEIGVWYRTDADDVWKRNERACAHVGVS